MVDDKQYIQFQGKRIDYTHVINPKLKHSYLQLRGGQVLLKTPRISQAQARQIVEKKARWVMGHMERLNIPKQEGLYPYLGRFYPLKMVPERGDRLVFLDGCFELGHGDIGAALEGFYREKAKQKLPEIVDTWSEIMKLKPAALQVKKQRRRWGSCTARNRILLNYHLVKLPSACIDLVIVHELAHLQHRNHSRQFWALVERFLPTYLSLRKELRHWEKKLAD